MYVEVLVSHFSFAEHLALHCFALNTQPVILLDNTSTIMINVLPLNEFTGNSIVGIGTENIVNKPMKRYVCLFNFESGFFVTMQHNHQIVLQYSCIYSSILYVILRLYDCNDKQFLQRTFPLTGHSNDSSNQFDSSI